MKIHQKKQKSNEYDNHIKWIQSKECENQANQFILDSRGYLEMVLKEKKFSDQRKHLTFNNAYYGIYEKSPIQNKKLVIEFKVPKYLESDIYEEIIDWVKRNVYLNKKARNLLEE